MTDTFSVTERSRIMAKVKSQNTKPEIQVRKFLFSKGFRFRTNVKNLPGTPDIVLSKYRTAIFVHGCFWHNHEGCRHATLPKTNIQYWGEKRSKNTTRDKENVDKLLALGWTVYIIWECEIKAKGSSLGVLNNIETSIKSHFSYQESLSLLRQVNPHKTK